MISATEHQWRFLQDVARLVLWVTRNKDGSVDTETGERRPNWRLTGGELWRDPRYQRWLFESGLSKARGGLHPERQAIDLNLFILEGDDWRWVTEGDAPEWAVLGSVWESLSLFNRWGGRFKDANHMERLRKVRTEPDLRLTV